MVSEKRPPLEAAAVQDSLQRVGIAEGDALLVHSDMMAVWVEPFPPDRLVPFFLENLLRAIGENGTLAVPAFYYEYARCGRPFDTRKSPVSKSLGVFSRHVASLPDAARSLNPITSIAAMGRLAGWVCGGDTAISNGINSPWHRLVEADGKMVFLGARIQAMTFVHYVEHLVGVPHLYSKLYSAPVSRDGIAVDLPVVAQVRYLNYDIEYDLGRFEADLESAGLIRTAPVGGGEIKVLGFGEVQAMLSEKLQRDCFYLLKRRPAFRAGEIPTDGDTDGQVAGS